MKTKRGIYLNLSESDIFTNFDEFRFYFSSNFNKERFEKNVLNYITSETLKLKNKYHIAFNFDLFFSISYYNKIEKRGFRVEEILTNKRLTANTIILNTII